VAGVVAAGLPVDAGGARRYVVFGVAGRQAYEPAAARDDRQRRQRAQYADQHRGRRVDLVKRALAASPGANPVVVIRSRLRAGRAARRTSSALYLAHKPVVLLDPPALRGTFAWRGPHGRAERGHAMMAGCPAVQIGGSSRVLVDLPCHSTWVSRIAAGALMDASGTSNRTPRTPGQSRHLLSAAPRGGA
jgi:hypothetical protein